jgi:ATP-dependent RNA helicase RhlE
VEESVRAYGKYLQLRSAVILGGVNIDAQIKALQAGVEILVATPGRLLDHVQQKTVSFPRVEVLVLDEADRMLDMGFLPDIKRILALLPEQRQNLLFSATFPDEVKRLAGQLLRNPRRIAVSPAGAAAENVRHRAHPIARTRKRELLSYLIRSRNLTQVLVFTATKLGANRLSHQLERDHISTATIHSDKSQPDRMKALNDFKQGAVRVLVATDIAARGLDIEALPCVINFELPRSPEDYVHRVGRTARAGASGEAISLVSPEENEQLAAIERQLKTELPLEVVPGFEPDAAGMAAALPLSPAIARPRVQQAVEQTARASALLVRPGRAPQEQRKPAGRSIPALFLPPIEASQQPDSQKAVRTAEANSVEVCNDNN